MQARNPCNIYRPLVSRFFSSLLLDVALSLQERCVCSAELLTNCRDADNVSGYRPGSPKLIPETITAAYAAKGIETTQPASQVEAQPANEAVNQLCTGPANETARLTMPMKMMPTGRVSTEINQQYVQSLLVFIPPRDACTTGAGSQIPNFLGKCCDLNSRQQGEGISYRSMR